MVIFYKDTFLFKLFLSYHNHFVKSTSVLLWI
jgi:hypothetical protein